MRAMRAQRRIICCLLVLLAGATHSFASDASEETFELKCADGFILDGKLHFPARGDSEPVKKVIILLHGSGAQSMDSDLTAQTKQGKKNLFFKEVADALANVGFAVVRYNKRSYQASVKAQEDPAYLSSEGFRALSENPFKYFVNDASDSVLYAKERFPEAEVFLLGHSQGTFIALQVARQMPEVKGVALIGFYSASMDTLLFEQTVNRPLSLFEGLDGNGDEQLDASELKTEDPVAASLRAQMAVVDLDSDKKISKLEFQAGNLSNQLVQDRLGVMREQEASYPRSAEILAAAAFKVAFFQGLLDNQTPAYHAKAVELVAKFVWKKDNFRFTYFPNLGHVLDARSSYDQLEFDTMDPGAKETLSEELKQFF